MNDEELRRRMAVLFAEYGGPIASFMEAVTAWAGANDFTSSLPEYYLPADRDHFCTECSEILVCADCEGLIERWECDCEDEKECETCGDDLVCASCQGYVRKPVETVA